MKNMDHNSPPIEVTAIPVSSASNNHFGYSISAPEAYNNHRLDGRHFDEVAVREYLSTYPYNWPKGLQDILINSLPKFPIRFFICDDSGSVFNNYCQFTSMINKFTTYCIPDGNK